MVAPAAGDEQFDAVYVPFTTVHQLLNLSKLNDITITAASTGDVTRVAKEVTELLRARHKITLRMADDFTVTTQARQALAKGGMRPDVARAVVGNVAGLEKVTLEQLSKDARSREQDDDRAAGEHRRRVAARRRHRHHEHHAAVGDGADARDRHAPRGRRARTRRAAAVRRRSGHAERGRRLRRRAARLRRVDEHLADPAMVDDDFVWAVVLSFGIAAPSASSSAGIPRARPRSSIRSSRCGTSRPCRCSSPVFALPPGRFAAMPCAPC